MSSDVGVVINIFVFKSKNQGAEGRNGHCIATWDACSVPGWIPALPKGAARESEKSTKESKRDPVGGEGRAGVRPGKEPELGSGCSI